MTDHARGATTLCGHHNTLARKGVRMRQVQSEKMELQKATQREKSREKRPRIPKVSDKRQLQLIVYDKLRIPWLRGKPCAVCGQPANQVHHMAGKEGELLNYVKWWLPVDGPCHTLITNDTVWAVANGYSLERNSQEVLAELRSLNLI